MGTWQELHIQSNLPLIVLTISLICIVIIGFLEFKKVSLRLDELTHELNSLKSDKSKGSIKNKNKNTKDNVEGRKEEDQKIVKERKVEEKSNQNEGVLKGDTNIHAEKDLSPQMMDGGVIMEGMHPYEAEIMVGLPPGIPTGIASMIIGGPMGVPMGGHMGGHMDGPMMQMGGVSVQNVFEEEIIPEGNKISIEERTNLGIFVFKPINEARDVMSIGPKNQANGILKNSATIALGTEIIITKANSLENIALKFSLLKGIAWLFCIIHDFRFSRNRTNYIFSY